MTTMEFSANAKAEFDKILKCYPDNQESAIMPVFKGFSHD